MKPVFGGFKTRLEFIIFGHSFKNYNIILNFFDQIKVSRVSILNRAFPSLHEGSLEIRFKCPLKNLLMSLLDNKIRFVQIKAKLKFQMNGSTSTVLHIYICIYILKNAYET